MQQIKWYFHPIVVFIFSLLAMSASLALYIYWYIEVSEGLRKVVIKYQLDPSEFFEVRTWVVILVLSVLVGMILIGLFIIFFYNQKTLQLYRMQHNFINNFTHELKTPVTSLKLYLDTFSKYELSREEQIKYIGFMIQDVDRLLDNINRILGLARIEGRSYTKEFVASDPVRTVRQFCDNNAGLFRNSDIVIHDPPEAIPPFRINPSLFEMLLMNLLTNAIKYNASERPRVDIRFVLRKGRVHICFEDNGIGIEKNEIKKIFRKFYQVGRSDDMSAKGSGLGLYLVKHIVKIHRGKVMTESDGSGKGTVFTLIFPVRA